MIDLSHLRLSAVSPSLTGLDTMSNDQAGDASAKKDLRTPFAGAKIDPSSRCLGCGRQYAGGHSVDCPSPLLQDASERMQAATIDDAIAMHSNAAVYQDDVRALLLALGLSDHARPESAHQVLQDEVLPAITALRTERATHNCGITANYQRQQRLLAEKRLDELLVAARSVLDPPRVRSSALDFLSRLVEQLEQAERPTSGRANTATVDTTATVDGVPVCWASIPFTTNPTDLSVPAPGSLKCGKALPCPDHPSSQAAFVPHPATPRSEPNA
jgi:hypothetical protein